MLLINTIPYLKQFILTDRSLNRYQNLSHPLLLRLSLEAPGTYHHSLMVANLSYKAAKEIGANCILARTGAYYHDIGKLQNPEIFIENQYQQDPLKTTNIQKIKLFAKKIINHVNFGIKLAKTYNLPPEIIIFIAEHHGTTTTLFFYNTAKKINSRINIKDFTYPGPKPLSAESAIVMISDAVEAKLRLIKDINKNNITETVNQIINDRILKNQLNLSGLNPSQINKIRKSLIETLITINHQRISY
jgi:hypothetical protein